MGFFDKVKDFFSDLLLGEEQRPPTPKTPEEARKYLDSVIPPRPEDKDAIEFLRRQGSITRMLEAIEEAAPGFLTVQPYSNKSWPRFAVGAEPEFPSIYELQNRFLAEYFSQNDRLALLYQRVTDPVGLASKIVEQDVRRHGGLLRMAKNIITDVIGRPIGAAFHKYNGYLSWLEVDAPWVTVWDRYGGFAASQAIEEASGDQVLKRAIARYRWEISGMNIWEAAKWMFGRKPKQRYEERVVQAVRDIQARGLRGQDAADAFEQWMRENPVGPAGMIGELAFSLATDPVSWIPLGALTRVTTKGLGMAVKAPLAARLGMKLEELKLPRLFRLIPGAPGRGMVKDGTFTIDQVLKMDEAMYRLHSITSAPPGPLRWLFERTPSRFGSEVATRIKPAILTISRTTFPVLDEVRYRELITQFGDDLGPRMFQLEQRVQRLRALDEFLKTGKYDADLLGEFISRDAINEPTLARFHALYRRADDVEWLGGRLSPDEDILSGIFKSDGTVKPEVIELLKRLPPEADSTYLWAGVTEHIGSIAERLQMGMFPRQMLKRWLPLIAMQKMFLGVFTLGRPGFVVLNMANNTFTFLWDTLLRWDWTIGQKARAMKFFAHSMFGELSRVFPGGGRATTAMERLARSVGLDSAAVEALTTDITSLYDILGRRQRSLDTVLRSGLKGEPFEREVKQTVDILTRFQNQPLKERHAFRLRDLIAAPVTVATAVDRAVRRATFYSNLAEMSHLALQPERIVPWGVIPRIADSLQSAGVNADEALRIEGVIQDMVRAHLRLSGDIDPTTLRMVWANAVREALRGRPSASLLAERYMQARGITGEAVAFGTRIHDPTLVELTRSIEKLQDELSSATSKEAVKLALRNFELSLSKIASDTNFLDHYLATISKHTPAAITRPVNNYIEALEATGYDIVRNHTRFIQGINEALLSQVPATAFYVDSYARVRTAAYAFADDLLRLRKVTQMYFDPTVGADDIARAWDEYRAASDDAFREFREAAEEFLDLFGNDQKVVDSVKNIFESMEDVRRRHWDIIEQTRSAVRGVEDDKAIAEAWTAAGTKVRSLFDEFWSTKAPEFFKLDSRPPSNDLFPALSTTYALHTDEFLSWVLQNYRDMPEFRRLIESAPVNRGVVESSLRQLLSKASLSADEAVELERLLAKQPWVAVVIQREAVNADLVRRFGNRLKTLTGISPIRLRTADDGLAFLIPGLSPELVPDLLASVKVTQAITPYGHILYSPSTGQLKFVAPAAEESIRITTDASRISRHLSGEERIPGTAFVFKRSKEGEPFLAVSLPEKRVVLDEIPPIGPKTPPLESELYNNLFDQFLRKYEQARSQIIRNAMWKTDFTMLNYNNQYGIDAILQMVAPYEFFPTRTVAHWTIRAWRNPAYAGLLIRTLFAPRNYYQKYGIPGVSATPPERVEWAIPIPMPGFGEFMNKLGLNGSRFQFYDWYWIDPLAIMFPLTNYRDTFDDELKRGTPAGMIADYFQQNTPLGISPLAIMAGSATGLLDEQAWHQTMFRGGPLGVPLNQWARATLSWLHTGDDFGMVPPEEKDLYTDRGHFSPNWLARTLGSATRWVGKAFGFGEQRFDEYTAERAIASLLASGEIPGETKEEQVRNALMAIYTHEGPVWEMGLRASKEEKFLREFTAWLGFRTVGMLEGEPIQLGLRALYAQARESSDPEALDKFYEKFPEYRVRQIVVRGVDDPKEKQKAVATELFYRDRQMLVNGQFDEPIKKIEEQLAELRSLPQTEPVRNQISILNANLRALREERDRWMNMLDMAYPDREDELSLLRDPHNRALARWRSKWYSEVADPKPGETEAEHNARKMAFLRQMAQIDPEEAMLRWDELTKEYFNVRVVYGLAKSDAIARKDFDELEKLDREQERRLREIHNRAERLVRPNDLILALVYDTREETKEEREFKDASLLFDIWMALVGDSSPLTGRQKRAVSAYFSSLPVMQKYYHTYTLDISKLSAGQIYALIRRRQIWRTFYDLADADSQLTYMTAVQDELNQLNEMLGLPPVFVVDVRRVPEPIPDDLPYRRALATMITSKSDKLKEDIAPLAIPSDIETLLATSDDESIEKAIQSLTPAEREALEGYLNSLRVGRQP